jgi:biotin carboxylase
LLLSVNPEDASSAPDRVVRRVVRSSREGVVGSAVVAGRVLVVGGFGTEVVDALARHGARSVLLQTSGATTEAQRRAVEEVIELPDLADRAAVLAACAAVHARSPLTGVLSLTEFGLAPAAALAVDLELPAPHSEATTQALRDKSEMRRILAAAGRDIGYSRVTTPSDAVASANRIGYPVVVKPCSSWGSLAVRRAESPSEVSAAADAVLEVSSAAVVERFLEGPEYSVEAFSTAGEHHIVAITGKRVVDMLEMGHVVPAPIAPENASEVEAAVGSFLDVVGVRDGATHTEVIVTEDGVLPVESHTRVGLDRIPELVRLATGVVLYEWAAGRVLGIRPVEPPRPDTGAAAIVFFHADPGAVTNIDGVDEARRAPGVVEVSVSVSVGDVVSRLAHSFDRCGYAIATGDDADVACARADHAVGLITVRTDVDRASDPADLRARRFRQAAGRSR